MKKIHLKSYLLIFLGVAVGALVFWQVGPQRFPATLARDTAAVQTAVDQERTISPLRDLSNAFVEISEKTSPAVVTVFTDKVLKVNQAANPFFFGPFDDFFGNFFEQRPQQDQPQEREFHQRGMGSGVIISDEGYILTNNHVIENADTVQVRMSDKKTFPAKLIGTDSKTDIALLKIDAKNLPTIKVGDSDQLRVGEWVLAIGSPLKENLDHTVTAGIVSAKGRSNLGLADYEDFIQTDAAINPGNSGGALVNIDGELVGINAAIISQSGGFQGIGFAVPINMAKQVMVSLLKNGAVVRGYLGAYIQDVNETMAKALNLPEPTGAIVADIEADGPGDKAGLKNGDVIIEMNDEKISSSTQLRNTIASLAPATDVTLKILRDGKEKDLHVKLEKLDAEEETSPSAQQVEKKLGFDVASLNKELAAKYELDRSLKGVIITKVLSGEAYQAGLKEGDLIVLVNRKSITGVNDFNKVVADMNKGDVVLLHIVRGDHKFFVAFTL
ncbi:DegQ family serine endoprotease [candidate division KSB1 bacterium]|nr:DegQ family serine endoprotease [candidate division KSB1 bacterium]